MGRKSKKQNSIPLEQPPVQNGLGDAIGFGSIGGFPQNQGSPFTEQISNVTTGFKNLRWYLVSNFRQFLSQAYVEWGLVQTVVDVPVDDGLRGGIELKSKQLDETQIAELLLSLDRDDDITIAAQAAKWNRLFGGAGVLILTDQDPEEPLNLDSINKDTPLEFRAVDMWELFWDKQNTEGYDPAIQSEDFDYYNYYGEQVHKSRVMRLKGITAPSFIRPRLRGWGFSVVETLIRSINQYLKATDLGFEVLDEFKLDVYKVKNLVNTLLSPNGDQKIKQRIALANYQKNYQNAIVMDSEDDFDHKQLSFAGLGEAMQSIRMQVASDMRMPLTKLFGISAAGFNSGEDDIEVYNAMVESQVRNKLKYILLRMCEIKCQHLFGMVPDDLSLSFKPLRVLSAEQEENVKTQKFQRLMQAKTAGELSVLEFRDACNKGNLFDVTLDTDDETLTMVEGFNADTVAEGANNPKDPQDIDNPGAGRLDTRKSRATEVGGAGKEPHQPAAPREPAAPVAKAGKIDPASKNSLNNAKWEESKHPRADDGKFGTGGGGKGSDPKKSLEALKGFDVDAILKAREEKEAAVREKNPAPPRKIKIEKPIDDKEVGEVLDKTEKEFSAIGSEYSGLKHAIAMWSLASFTNIRDVQRGQDQRFDPIEKERVRKLLKDMEENFSVLPDYEGPLVRDINLELEDALKQFKSGDSFVLDAFSSFTARARYTTHRKIRLVVEKSNKGKSIWGLSQSQEEMEVLVPKGQKYEILRVEEHDEAPYVRVYLKEA